MKDGKVGTKLLTLDDLAERWSVSRKVALRMVREDKIPFVIVGKAKADLSRRGPKSHRFRLETIEQWERRGEQCYGPGSPVSDRRAREAQSLGIREDVKGWL